MKTIVTIATSSILLLLAFALNENALAEERYPIEYPSPDNISKNDATAMKRCMFARLKSQEKPNCVITDLQNKVLSVAVYDDDSHGHLVRSSYFCVGSWYEEAQVHIVEPLGDGRQFLDIVSEGNTGTGTLQKIRMIVGWNGKNFVPSLVETVSYRMESLGYLRSLDLSIKFDNKNPNNILAQLKYNYTEGQVTNASPENLWRSTSEWSEVLRWDTVSFSFYKDPQPDKKRQLTGFRPDLISTNIRRSRQYFKGKTMQDLCGNYLSDYLESSMIMELFDENAKK